MSRRLSAYRALCDVACKLDERGDPLADCLRDAMDFLWFEMTAEEHAALDQEAA